MEFRNHENWVRYRFNSVKANPLGVFLVSILFILLVVPILILGVILLGIMVMIGAVRILLSPILSGGRSDVEMTETIRRKGGQTSAPPVIDVDIKESPGPHSH